METSATRIKILRRRKTLAVSGQIIGHLILLPSRLREEAVKGFKNQGNTISLLSYVEKPPPPSGQSFS